MSDYNLRHPKITYLRECWLRWSHCLIKALVADVAYVFTNNTSCLIQLSIRRKWVARTGFRSMTNQSLLLNCTNPLERRNHITLNYEFTFRKLNFRDNKTINGFSESQCECSKFEWDSKILYNRKFLSFQYFGCIV